MKNHDEKLDQQFYEFISCYEINRSTHSEYRDLVNQDIDPQILKHVFLSQIYTRNIDLTGCFGLTEANAGSDPGSMKTYAKKVEGGWKINGTKLWATNAPFADIAIIWANTDNGIRGFIVEKSMKGFSVNKIEMKLSLRASSTGEIVLSDVFVPDENLLCGTQRGLSTALTCLTRARYGIAWGALGAASTCYETALDYCKFRKQFDVSIASKQLVQKDLVEMFLALVKGTHLNLHIGRQIERGQSHFGVVCLAKMNAASDALKIARQARNLLGANGISLEYHVMRHMNNLESVFTYEGTDTIHHLIVGQLLTGESAI